MFEFLFTGFSNAAAVSELMPLALVDYAGGVGNIVSAGMQTKGLIDQAAMLENLKDELEWIAALAWLVSICIGIGAVAVFGNYRQAAYLLIGPPLFYYMITTTIQTDGTKAIFGDRQIEAGYKDQKDLHRWVRSIGEEDVGTVNISFFFGVYDSIITEMVQKVVSVVLDTKNRQDLRFIARERVMNHVLHGITDRGPLSQLILANHLGDCGEIMDIYVREIERIEKSEKNPRDEKDIDAGSNKVGDEWQVKNIALTNDVKRFLIGLREKKVEKSEKVPFSDEYDEQLVSCEQIWEFVQAGLFDYAGERLSEESFRRSSHLNATEYPVTQAIQDVNELLEKGSKGEEAAHKILAIFIYQRTLTTGSGTALQGQVFNRSPFQSKQFESVFGDLQNAEARGGFFMLKYFARTIPYVQGMLLYLLTIAFPFFAIFLVLPGKAPSFFAWMSLWAWVKSWDIGFALVHVARDIFWQMMGGGINIFDSKAVWNSTPPSVLRVAFQNDPSLTQNTYWILISGLTLMVPVVTAHVAMGATNMFDMFKGSIDQVAVRFGQAEANAGRRREGNISEALMDEHESGAVRLYTVAQAVNPHATTGTGVGFSAQDLNLGAFGGVTHTADKGERAGQTVISKVATSGRHTNVGITPAYAQYLLQTAPDSDIDGGILYEKEKTKSLEAYGKLHNLSLQAAALTKSGDTAGAAELTEQIGKAEEEWKGTTYNTEETLFGKDDKGNLIKPPQDKKMPESIFYAFRGFLSMQEKMTDTAVKNWISENKRMARLMRMHGRGYDANEMVMRSERIEAKLKYVEGLREQAEALEKKGDKEGAKEKRKEAEDKSYSWADYFHRQRQITNDLQNRLAVVTRRRQYRMKRRGPAGRGAMARLLTKREKNALNAVSFFDAISRLKELPGVEAKEAFLLNPYGMDQKISIYGGIFVGSGDMYSGAEGSAAEYEEGAQGADSGDGGGE